MKSLESIECDLFESCKGRVTTCANIFDQCTNLHTIYNGLFEGFDKCTDFSLAFHYTALNSIPANTFRGCTSAVKFNSTFSAIPNILSIPAGLFDDCVNAKEFAFTFELLNISSVPERLFAKCVKATFSGELSDSPMLLLYPVMFLRIAGRLKMYPPALRTVPG